MSVKTKRDTSRAALINATAEKTGYTRRYVRYVLESQRENETVKAVYMTLLESQNTILTEVTRLVPLFKAPKSPSANQ